jgi:hypothetical protein
MLVMDDSYTTDKEKCESNFWKIVNRYVRIPPLVHMPKPEPPIGLRETLQWSAQVRQDLAKNYRANPQEVQHVADLLAKYFGVDVEEFLKEANVKGA